jgi:hypothetical protein
MAENRNTGGPTVVERKQPTAAPFDSSRRPGQVKVRTRTRSLDLRLLTLDDLDQRTTATTRAKHLVAGFVRDLGKTPSTAQSQLAQRGALLAAMCEHFETEWIAGKQVDLGLYGYLTNVQRRVLTSIGLERRARDINGRSKIDLLIDAVERAVPE